MGVWNLLDATPEQYCVLIMISQIWRPFHKTHSKIYVMQENQISVKRSEFDNDEGAVIRRYPNNSLRFIMGPDVL